MVSYVAAVATLVDRRRAAQPFAKENSDGLEFSNDFESQFYLRIQYTDGVGIVKDLGEICEKHGVSIYSLLQVGRWPLPCIVIDGGGSFFFGSSRSFCESGWRAPAPDGNRATVLGFSCRVGPSSPRSGRSARDRRCCRLANDARRFTSRPVVAAASFAAGRLASHAQNPIANRNDATFCIITDPTKRSQIKAVTDEIEHKKWANGLPFLIPVVE